jgi:hypothetical protein
MSSTFYTLLLSSTTEAVESEPLPFKTPSIAVTVQVRDPLNSSTTSQASDGRLVSTFNKALATLRLVQSSWSRPKKHRINVHPKNINCLPVLFTRHHLLGSVLLPLVEDVVGHHLALLPQLVSLWHVKECTSYSAPEINKIEKLKTNLH